jgi:hypothetical protein
LIEHEGVCFVKKTDTCGIGAPYIVEVTGTRYYRNTTVHSGMDTLLLLQVVSTRKGEATASMEIIS